MANETEFASDSDDGFITKIVGDDLEYLKQRLSQCILESKDLTAEIHHLAGQPAKLFLTMGTKGKCDYSSTSICKPGTKLLVKNLPDTADEDHLEMFFEHKRQGGGTVKRVTIHKDDGLAIIEFQEANAVDKVLKKQPIKMLGKTVEVEKYTPYLQDDEGLKFVQLRRIPKELSKDIATMKLKNKIGKSDHGTFNALTLQDSDSDNDENAPDSSDNEDDDVDFGGMFIHPRVECDGCGQRIAGVRYKCRSCRDFDFCSSCKKRCAHNPNHIFMKITHPMMPLTSPLLQSFGRILK